MNDTFLSPQDYLERERSSQVRHQYDQGEMFAMSGASRAHNLINVNLVSQINRQLVAGSCEAYVSDMRIKISATGLYTYADLVVACGQREFEDEHVDTLLNPTLIAEVLSDSTEAYDRGEKFAQYRRLASLQEFLLISQDEMRVERYIR